MAERRAEEGVLAHAEVRLWGSTLGAVAELDSGRILFEYADGFRRLGLEISPLRLPLSLAGPRAFDELQNKPAFGGLPGVLADSLPDAFGNKVIRAYFAARGEEERALSPVQRLLYVGERALGALTFHPAEDLPLRPLEMESLEVAALVRDARRIVQGEPGVAIPEIYRIGASAGGMRPKAIVHYDPRSGSIRSGNVPPRDFETPCILKFDGVGDGATTDELGLPQPYNRIEAAYNRMARGAGLKTSEVAVLEDSGHAHLLVTRFDMSDGQRIHQHTLGGLLHLDYNDPGASSYEEYLRAALELGMAQDAVLEGYRRMVFNVLAVNQDDHVKNLSFHMDENGAWSLAPAYDLTFAKGRGFTASHQMRVQDKTSGITGSDLLAVAAVFGIKRAQRILDEVAAAVQRWEGYAAEFGVPEQTMAEIARELEERRRSLAS